jgi:hypothetical protein
MNTDNLHSLPNGFAQKEGEVNGKKVILVTPEGFAPEWKEENLCWRSVLLDAEDHTVVSRGFKKFFNLGEKPAVDPFPEGPFSAVEKKDGSLLIVSKYKGDLVVRTRGTIDARLLENGHELNFLMEKYHQAFDNALIDNGVYSLLFEWQTPNNIIVINEVTEPTLTLVGAVKNSDGFQCLQGDLDELGAYYHWPRPRRYPYSSIEECVDDVKFWKGKEGVVLYSWNGQHMRKVKAEEYLRLHRAKSSISSISKLVDLYMNTDRTEDPQDFYNYVERSLDHELAEIAKEDLIRIVNAYIAVKKEMATIEGLVADFWSRETRKDAALDITRRYKDWRAAYAFSLLNNKAWEDKRLAEILEQGVKNEINQKH